MFSPVNLSVVCLYEWGCIDVFIFMNKKNERKVNGASILSSNTQHTSLTGVEC